jgi:hypothetical protein
MWYIVSSRLQLRGGTDNLFRWDLCPESSRKVSSGILAWPTNFKRFMLLVIAEKDWSQVEVWCMGTARQRRFAFHYLFGVKATQSSSESTQRSPTKNKTSVVPLLVVICEAIDCLTTFNLTRLDLPRSMILVIRHFE